MPRGLPGLPGGDMGLDGAGLGIFGAILGGLFNLLLPRLQQTPSWEELRKSINLSDHKMTNLLTHSKGRHGFSDGCGIQCIEYVHEDPGGKGKIIKISKASDGKGLKIYWEGICEHGCVIVIEYYFNEIELNMHVSTAYHKNGECKLRCQARL